MDRVERWRRAEEIYYKAVECGPEQREAILDASCSGDADLRREVELLLAARENAGDFLSSKELAGQIAQLGFERPPPAIGAKFGEYDILSLLGAGAMGEVYRARDSRLGREVALKILPPHLTGDAARVSRFQREARAASALNHPNTATIYEIGQAGGTWYIAAELIQGVTLRERMSGGKLPMAEAIQIAMQCAAALGTAHRAGIVHRDLKPENIMIRPDGVAKVVDFGLARMMEADSEAPNATQTGSVMGTPRYMSPEQAEGRKPDARSDIFSLGAVLFEMVAGQPAFPGQTAAQVFAAVLGSQPRAAAAGPLAPVISKSLEKDRAKRYQTMEELADALGQFAPNPDRPAVLRRIPVTRRVGLRAAALSLAILAALGAGLVFYLRQHPLLTEADTILLADFENQTSDPVFDPTLKQGLAVQLEQSPFLNIFPDARVQASLRRMRRAPGDRVTREIAQEICKREGIKALIVGAIAPLGRQYVITLEAADSQTGDTLARVQIQVAEKEQVLHGLSQAASNLRQKLGESVHSIRKFDALLERTTPSIEALRAYSLGYETRRKGDFLGAIPFFRRALEFDPDFASAYEGLANSYRNTRQPGLAAQCSEKAYALRDRVSERERLGIMSQYYELVTGELDKRIEILKLFENSYPRDPVPNQNLAVTYALMGQYEQAMEESQKAIALDADTASRFAALTNALVHLNRFAEARKLLERARARKLDDTSIHQSEYRLAFMNRDAAAMEEQVQWISGRADEYIALDWHAATAAYLGQWRRSADSARRAIDGARRAGAGEIAAAYAAENSLRAASLGQCADTKTAATQALSMERTPATLTRAALALGWCGDSGAVQPLMDELTRLYPVNTVVNGIWLPSARAALELKQGRAESAIAALAPVVRYEAAAGFWPQYLRGQAYVRLGKGQEAEAEFRRIVDHRGQDVLSPLYPLARLGVARGALLAGDKTQARKSLGEFLSDWSGADRGLQDLRDANEVMAHLSK